MLKKGNLGTVRRYNGVRTKALQSTILTTNSCNNTSYGSGNAEILSQSIVTFTAFHYFAIKVFRSRYLESHCIDCCVKIAILYSEFQCLYTQLNREECATVYVIKNNIKKSKCGGLCSLVVLRWW